MKKIILVLAATMMATASYNQTSRRSANSNSGTENNRSKSTYTRPDNNSSRTTRVNSERTTSTRTVNANRDYSNRNSTSSRTVSSQSNNSSRVIAHDRDAKQTSQNTHSVNNRGNYSSNNNDRHSVNNSSRNNHSSRTVYASSPSSRVYRGSHQVTHVYHTPPQAKSYRVKHYSYRRPVHVDIIWTRDMHRNYLRMYPDYHYYNYSYGYRINSISAYDADYYIGDVKNVYGEITEVYYARESDEYFLYVGPHYPYQDFTVVVPGHIARNYSRRPEYYFNHEYINVTGLITAFEGKPEIVVKRNYQLNVY